jgi:hypothetical protein
MDFSAAIFGLTIVAISAWIAYQWGIKPDRERRKLRNEQLLAELRRQQGGRLAKREPRVDSTKAAPTAALHRQSPS